METMKETGYSLQEARNAVQAYAHATGKNLSHRLPGLVPGEALDDLVNEIYSEDWSLVKSASILGMLSVDDEFFFVYCDGTTSPEKYKVSRIDEHFCYVRPVGTEHRFDQICDAESVHNIAAKVLIA